MLLLAAPRAGACRLRRRPAHRQLQQQVGVLLRHRRRALLRELAPGLERPQSLGVLGFQSLSFPLHRRVHRRRELHLVI